MPRLSTGTVLSNKYVIGRLLGVGGMGEVYEAVQTDLSRRVAIKILVPELAGDPEMFARFQREAAAAAGLGHPNIVQVTDFHNEPGEPPYLVMEHLEGQSLRDVLKSLGRLPPERATHIAVQLLAALAAAHAAGIVHRDVKPGNIFLLHTLAATDYVKLLDFGIAKLTTARPGDDRAPLTRAGQVLGTTGYMAPEQAFAADVDARADVFAAGAVLFHAIAGRKPRDDGSFEGAALSPCRKLLDVAPDAPAQLAAVVDKALERNPDARFASATEMAQALLGLPRGPSDGRATPMASPQRATDAATTLEVRAPEPVTTRAPALPQPGPRAAEGTLISVAPAPQPPAPTYVSSAPGPVQPPVAAPPRLPAPAFAPPARPQVRPRVPPGPSHWWTGCLGLAGVAAGVVVLSGISLAWCLNGSSKRMATEKAMLDGAAACVAPSQCTGTYDLGDRSLKACSYTVGPADREYFAGEIVVLTNSVAAPGAVRVVEHVPGTRDYRVEDPGGIVLTCPASRIAARICH